jgi:hypothetical protein
MKPPTDHRCGKHVVNANPRSQIPIWAPCHVHRSGDGSVRQLFQRITQLEFTFEEDLRLGLAVRYGMLE